ncbi:hypothetical protein DCS_00127 [Drechmeria coniospora]|uniref:Uncharacterized protein n=1 Tax=Drechmeria coniospora TaxID=98403 RepID=A0A151GPI8_DRECN|nr:hypothetical protein DCS_00127 [Drechmeria coniospora]KYK59000.1 hypothetical protein DCS_00127 [Drechmeria coniospora]
MNAHHGVAAAHGIIAVKHRNVKTRRSGTGTNKLASLLVSHGRPEEITDADASSGQHHDLAGSSLTALRNRAAGFQRRVVRLTGTAARGGARSTASWLSIQSGTVGEAGNIDRARGGKPRGPSVNVGASTALGDNGRWRQQKVQPVQHSAMVRAHWHRKQPGYISETRVTLRHVGQIGTRVPIQHKYMVISYRAQQVCHARRNGSRRHLANDMSMSEVPEEWSSITPGQLHQQHAIVLRSLTFTRAAF